MTGFFQLLLIIVVSTLTFLITFAAIQVFHILHEFRITIKRLNRILDRTQSLTMPIAPQAVSETKSQTNETSEDRIIAAHQHESLKRRFFRRSGLPLHPS